jgi:hypothetical protein
MWGSVMVHLAKSIDMLEYLLFTMGCEACGIVTGEGSFWSTVLHKECDSGTLEHASLLIWAGADINARDSHGLAPMAYALHGISLHPQLMCRYLEHCGMDMKQVCHTAQQRARLRGVRESFQQVSTGPSLRRTIPSLELNFRLCNYFFEMYLCHI